MVAVHAYYVNIACIYTYSINFASSTSNHKCHRENSIPKGNLELSYVYTCERSMKPVKLILLGVNGLNLD